MKNIAEKITDIWEEHTTGVSILLITGVVIGSLALGFGIMCLRSLIVMLLWNWVAVSLFGAPVLSFWVAFCLRWLCSLLFKSHITVNKKSEN